MGAFIRPLCLAVSVCNALMPCITITCFLESVGSATLPASTSFVTPQSLALIGGGVHMSRIAVMILIALFIALPQSSAHNERHFNV